MSNTTAGILGVITGIIILYLIFRKKVNTYFGIFEGDSASWASCNKQFYVKLNDGKTQAVFSSNDGTEDNPDWKYYKNDVTFTEEGITGATAPIKITKTEFDGLCKFKYDPPYKWYSINTSEIVGHRK